MGVDRKVGQVVQSTEERLERSERFLKSSNYWHWQLKYAVIAAHALLGLGKNDDAQALLYEIIRQVEDRTGEPE